ncbi:MAG: DNA translocase FtsK 4TM domain-containing protein [candidate division WOR-3 bacterium]|nr:DNA translocase FtsK 4TM domain-containing protein [candidate division WOR-3 bacterium]
MIILNSVIMAVLVGFLIGSLILTVKDMDNRRKRRMNGIVLLFLFFIIYSSILTYSPGGDPLKNFGGIVGSFIAKSIHNTFGISFYLLPFILIIGAIALFTNRIKQIFYRFGGLFVWTFFFVLLIQSIHPTISEAKKGQMGIAVGNFLVKKMSLNGSIALISFLFLIILYIYLHPVFKFNFGAFLNKLRKMKPTATKRIEDKFSVEVDKKAQKIEWREKQRLQRNALSKKTAKVKSQPSYLMSDSEFQTKFLETLNDPVEMEWMSERTINKYKKVIENKLKNFDITGRITGVTRGPVVSRFEFKPDPGIKLSKISNLSSDLALALRAEKIRIIAPIPGKGVVGIEVPNRNREMVFIKELIDNETFKENPSITYIPIGKDITGRPLYSSIASMPHLLIAGATGSGKSVFINSIITSLLYKAKPSELRFILIDPKRIELSIYNGIPHLIRSVISDQSTSIQFLNKVLECMEKRYEEFARVGVRDIQGYNRKIKDRKPYIFIIIDELADLMMRSGREVENAVIRLAQMSRAVGIHLILATQRPSVDVITGLIKANFPARIAFQVASRHDSKTIMDTGGAEQLLGNGDMLFTPPDEGVPKRLHGPLVTTEETKKLVYLIGLIHLRKLLKVKFENPDLICSYIKEEDVLDVLGDRMLPGAGERIEEFSKLLNRELGIQEEKFTEFVEGLDYYPPTEEIEKFLEIKKGPEELKEVDELFEEAKRIVIDRQSASVSLLQRKFKIGYARAGRLIDQLERAGIVGKFKGSKPREVLVKRKSPE